MDPSTRNTTVLDQLLDPVRDCLTVEVAARIVALRADHRTQDRLDELAEKCREGQLTLQEQEEYEAMVDAAVLIAVLQAKARTLLTSTDQV